MQTSYLIAGIALAMIAIIGMAIIRVGKRYDDYALDELPDPEHCDNVKTLPATKVSRDALGHPLYAKWSTDTREGCRACGQTWTDDDFDPPECTAGAMIVQQCVHCGIRWRLGQAIPRHCVGEK